MARLAGRLGVAVLGAGRIGALHARNVATHAPRAKLIGVADVDDSAARRVAEATGARASNDAETFLRDPDVQAVVIATSTDMHAQLIEAAARAGKQTFCEKPIALTLSGTRTAMAAAERAGILLQIGFQRRFDPPYVRARRLIEDGSIGKPWLIRLFGRDARIAPLEYLRTSGGQYKDQAIHEFDVARWLVSPLDIEEIFATGSVLVDPAVRDIGDVDTSLVTLRYHGGTLGVIETARQTAEGYQVGGEVRGSAGSVTIENGRATSARSDAFLERFAEAYCAEIVDFTDAVLDERAPRVSARDALEAMRLAVAADRSQRERRAVALADVVDD